MKYFHYFVLLCGIFGLGCSPEIEEVSMPEFMQHVRSGSLYYEEKNIKIRTSVAADVSQMESLFDMRGVILLETFDGRIPFYVTKLKNAYEKGKTYTFTLFIEDINYTEGRWSVYAEDIQ